MNSQDKRIAEAIWPRHMEQKREQALKWLSTSSPKKWLLAEPINKVRR